MIIKCRTITKNQKYEMKRKKRGKNQVIHKIHNIHKITRGCADLYVFRFFPPASFHFIFLVFIFCSTFYYHIYYHYSISIISSSSTRFKGNPSQTRGAESDWPVKSVFPLCQCFFKTSLIPCYYVSCIFA